MKEPLFHSFVAETADKLTIDAGSSGMSGENVMGPNKKIVEYLHLNKVPTFSSLKDLANAAANDIIKQCDKNNWSVVLIDLEWALSSNLAGPDGRMSSRSQQRAWILLYSRSRSFQVLLHCWNQQQYRRRRPRFQQIAQHLPRMASH